MSDQDSIPKRFHFPSPGFTRYWEIGRGKQLRTHAIGVFPDEKEIKKRIPLFNEVDELADRVIREVMLVHGHGITLKWIEDYLSGQPTETLPDSLKQLLDFSAAQPSWLDTILLEKGALLCRRSGPVGFMVLRNYCLMGGYESSAINKPLIFTEALKKGAAKRTSETTEFWVKVVGEKALQNPSLGIKECVFIRLMHAYARVSILQRSDWKTEDWGLPLNQWDMVATNLGFSVAFLDGLRALGMKPTSSEVEGLLHLWKYVGYLLGIPEHYLPSTESEAIHSLYAWTMTQPPADVDTQSLAQALMNEPLTSNFPKKMWQKRRVVQVHLGYNYFFLGGESCKAMGLPVKGWTIYPNLLRLLTSFQEFFNHRSNKVMKRNAKKRRKQQEKIAFIFLKGHGKH